MNEARIAELVDHLEGLVAGRLIEVHKRERWIPEHREVIKRISHNVAAYAAGQLREVYRVSTGRKVA